MGTAAGSVSAYVSRAAKVFNELEKPQVCIKASGNALTKAVTLAEVVKRRFKDLHQITTLGSTQIVDEYEPLEEGLDKVIRGPCLSSKSSCRRKPWIPLTRGINLLLTNPWSLSLN